MSEPQHIGEVIPSVFEEIDAAMDGEQIGRARGCSGVLAACDQCRWRGALEQLGPHVVKFHLESVCGETATEKRVAESAPLEELMRTVARDVCAERFPEPIYTAEGVDKKLAECAARVREIAIDTICDASTIRTLIQSVRAIENRFLPLEAETKNNSSHCCGLQGALNEITPRIERLEADARSRSPLFSQECATPPPGSHPNVPCGKCGVYDGTDHTKACPPRAHAAVEREETAEDRWRRAAQRYEVRSVPTRPRPLTGPEPTTWTARLCARDEFITEVTSAEAAGEARGEIRGAENALNEIDRRMQGSNDVNRMWSILCEMKRRVRGSAKANSKGD